MSDRSAAQTRPVLRGQILGGENDDGDGGGARVGVERRRHLEAVEARQADGEKLLERRRVCPRRVDQLLKWMSLRTQEPRKKKSS